jgi:hypothetical protein
MRIVRSRRCCDWRDAGYLGVLCLVAVLYLWPVYQQPDGLWYAPGAAYSDLTVTFWPNMWFLAESLRQYGQIPLWRPLIMGGAPFVGNPQSALFYPPNWLFLFLPVTRTFHLLIGLHLLGAGAAMYGLVRCSYCCSRFAAVVAAIGYMLTSKLTAHLGAGHIGLSQAFAWLPLAFWLLRHSIENQSVLMAAGCGTVLAAMFFAYPPLAAHATALLAGYALYRLVAEGLRVSGRSAVLLALRLLPLPVWFLAVGAVQIVPTLELMGVLSRADLSLAEAGRDSLPWRYLLGYLIADYGGYHEWMTYLGLPVLGLGLLALVRGVQSDRWFWAAVSIAGVLFSLGIHGPLYPVVYRLVPLSSWLRVPPRALLIVALAANVLAALGVEALFERGWQRAARARARLAALAGLLFFVGLGLGFALILGDRLPPAVRSFAIVGSGTMVILLLAVHGQRSQFWGRALLLAVLVADLWLVDRSLLELRGPGEAFKEGAEAASYVVGGDEPFRVYSPSYSVPQHVGARYGLHQLDGVDPIQLQWVVEFMEIAGGYQVDGYGVTIPYFPDDADVKSVWREATPSATLLGLLNVRYLVADYPAAADGLSLVHRTEESYVYENSLFMPRAFLVRRASSVRDWQEAQQRLRDGFDPSRAALVVGGKTLDGPPGWRAASVTSFTPNQIVVSADPEGPSLLVLSEVWYPGWQVWVDGAAQPYFLVDGIIRGVYLDAGYHRVVWRYQPSSLRWGAALTLAGLCGLGGISLAQAVGRGRRREPLLRGS